MYVIIYGYRTSNKIMGKMPMVCPKCQQQGAQTIVRSRRMLTLFWIPLFPISKNTITRCGQCGAQMKIDNKQADAYFAQQPAAQQGTPQGTPPTDLG